MTGGDWIDDRPPLVRAASRGESDVVDVLIRGGVDPNQADGNGWTALHAAAVFDHAEVVGRLLQAGVVVDARTHDGFTPLLNAAKAGKAVIAALLDAGADPMAQTWELGWRPLDRFAEHGNVDGVRLILEAGAEVDARDAPDGTTALMDAAEAGEAECVELLLRAGADPSLMCDGETASALAAKHGHHELAALLSEVR